MDLETLVGLAVMVMLSMIYVVPTVLAIRWRHPRWLVLPFDRTGERTLVIYDALISPHLPAPRALVHAGQKSSLRSVFTALRKLTVR